MKMHINGTNFSNNQQLFSSGSNPAFLGKLVARDQPPPETESILDKDLPTQDELLEKLIEETEKAERALNSGKKYDIQAADTDESPEEANAPENTAVTPIPYKVHMPLDRYHIMDAFTNYKGSGNATSAAEVQEDLAARENWVFSWGRDVDMKGSDILGTRGISYGAPDASKGYAMRMRYDEGSSADNPSVLVETLDEDGKRNAYRVALNEVNASSASVVEAFAVISHLTVGEGNGDGIYKGFDAAALMNTFMLRPSHEIDHSKAQTVTSGPYSIGTGGTRTFADERLDFEQRIDFTTFGQKDRLEGLYPG